MNELPDYNEDGSANPKGDAIYWRTRAEKAEADRDAMAEEDRMSSDRINRLMEGIKQRDEYIKKLKQHCRELWGVICSDEGWHYLETRYGVEDEHNAIMNEFGEKP